MKINDSRGRPFTGISKPIDLYLQVLPVQILREVHRPNQRQNVRPPNPNPNPNPTPSLNPNPKPIGSPDPNPDPNPNLDIQVREQALTLTLTLNPKRKP